MEYNCLPSLVGICLGSEFSPYLCICTYIISVETFVSSCFPLLQNCKESTTVMCVELVANRFLRKVTQHTAICPTIYSQSLHELWFNLRQTDG